jgi:hypothetical protein
MFYIPDGFGTEFPTSCSKEYQIIVRFTLRLLMALLYESVRISYCFLLLVSCSSPVVEVGIDLA